LARDAGEPEFLRVDWEREEDDETEEEGGETADAIHRVVTG
jgi:hypothetical protein